MDWSDVDIIVMFLSAGTHSLQDYWELDLSKSDEETKSSILDGLRIHFQQILISGWTIPLKLSIR